MKNREYMFLEHPDESKLKEITLDDFEKDILNLIEKSKNSDCDYTPFDQKKSYEERFQLKDNLRI